MSSHILSMLLIVDASITGIDTQETSGKERHLTREEDIPLAKVKSIAGEDSLWCPNLEPDQQLNGYLLQPMSDLVAHHMQQGKPIYYPLKSGLSFCKCYLLVATISIVRADASGCLVSPNPV